MKQISPRDYFILRLRQADVPEEQIVKIMKSLGTWLESWEREHHSYYNRTSSFKHAVK